MTANKQERVGFIGLGAMGVGMAANVAKAGFPLTVLGHSRREPVERLIAMGATEATTAAQVAEQSDIVVLCVTTSDVVEELISGKTGLLAGGTGGKNLLVIDCGTSNPVSTSKLGELLKSKGGALMDVPLGRSAEAAEAGMLNMMAGGDEADFNRAKPVLDTMSENLFHLGPLGTGHKIKLLNNACSVSIATLLGEVIKTASKSGIDPKQLSDVIAAGPISSDFISWVFAGPIDNDETKLQFSLKNACKDIGYFADFAQDVGVDATVAKTAHQRIKKIVDSGNGEEFIPAVHRLI